MANSCKFQKTQYQVSYDSGTTWEDVVPTQFAKGELLEYDSPDCTSIETIYRWRTLEGQYICDGNNKYKKEIQEESYNNGITWYTSYPTIYRQGQYVGEDAEFCCDKFVGHYIYSPSSGSVHHTCPKWYKWNGYQCVYVDPIKVVKCDGSSMLTSDETKYYTNNYKLISAEIGDNITSIGNSAFTFSYSLSSITIPSGVTNIGQSAFYECTGLTSITVEALTPPTLNNSGFSVFGNTNNCPIYVPCESLDTYRQASGWSNYAIRLEGISPCQEPTPTGETKLYCTYENTSDYFVHCNSDTTLSSSESKPNYKPYSAMTNAVIGDCVTTIGDGVFYQCTSLTSVTIPNTVTSIYTFPFRECYSLKSITIPSGVTNIGNSAFYYCTSLTSVTIPSNVTNIGNYAFANCTSLTSITMEGTTPPELDYKNVFDNTNNCPIYVPSGSVNAYKTAHYWSNYSSRIQAIT